MKKSSSKSVNVLIANAASPKNPGDQAMLAVLIRLVKNVHPHVSITVHTVDPHLYTNSDVKVDHTLYSWSVFAHRRTFVRFERVLKLLIQYVVLRMGFKIHAFDAQLSTLVKGYKNADLILFVGGGYLRSKKGITQGLNLLMQLFLFEFASLFSAKKIVGPVSIGPFGHAWQEKLVAHVLKKMDRVATREDISFATLQKYALKNTVRSADHAILTQKKQNKIKSPSSGRTTIGFTIRQWLKGKKQAELETSVLWALKEYVGITGARIQPIVQVDAPEYGDDDKAITAAMARRLKSARIVVLPIRKIHTIKEAVNVYSELDLLLGMRMHSNIFAATQSTPFVAISYEHKTEGISKQLGMEKYCIACETIEGKRLFTLLTDAYTHRKHLRTQLARNVYAIQKRDTKQWENYLSL